MGYRSGQIGPERKGREEQRGKGEEKLGTRERSRRRDAKRTGKGRGQGIWLGMRVEDTRIVVLEGVRRYRRQGRWKDLGI
jgi:hypothetical protein